MLAVHMETVQTLQGRGWLMAPPGDAGGARHLSAPQWEARGSRDVAKDFYSDLKTVAQCKFRRKQVRGGAQLPSEEVTAHLPSLAQEAGGGKAIRQLVTEGRRMTCE